MSGDEGDFRAVMRFEGRAAFVVVSGNFGSVAPAELQSILDAAIERRPTSIMLDLTALDGIGASGLTGQGFRA